MTINLYMNNSPANFVSKSLTLVETMTGTLRTPTSVINPTILIQRASPIGFNYAQIPEYNRFYFVTGISSQSNNLIAVSLHVDVLTTYQTSVLQADAIVKRQEYKWNMYLDDGIFKAYQPTLHKMKVFPNGFFDYSYVLTLAGNGENS